MGREWLANALPVLDHGVCGLRRKNRRKFGNRGTFFGPFRVLFGGDGVRKVRKRGLGKNLGNLRGRDFRRFRRLPQISADIFLALAISRTTALGCLILHLHCHDFALCQCSGYAADKLGRCTCGNQVRDQGSNTHHSPAR